MKRHERGSVAIECVAVLPFLFTLLAGTLFFSRFLWHYTVAEKAAQDAATFLASASAPELQMQSSTGDAYVVLAAKAMAKAELAELNPGLYLPVTSIYCDGVDCVPWTLPKIVSVHVGMQVVDPILAPFTSMFNSDGSDITIRIDATGRSYYVGN
jgi:hypothetical protein